MKRFILVAILIGAIAAPSAFASLKVGTKAPLFTAEATLGGKVYGFSLADALKKGPVVLYFYPAAFTKGCTIEAHDFAEAMDKYHALGATVIGVSHDNIATLKKFSVSACRSKFPVAADTNHEIMHSYDAVMPQHSEYANRTSYVIAPDGTIIYTYTNINPDQHVANTLAALKRWKSGHGQ
ncbi:MAG: peroxiredoxin [Gammaproteobacteria bacterium]